MIQIGDPSATLDTPIEHLLACHRRIEQRLDTLVKAADHFLIDRAGAMAAVQKSFQFLESSGARHTEDEEGSLFPRLRPHLSAAELEFVESLEAEHREADRVYSELKALAEEVSEATLPSYRECAESLRALYRKHIRAEDEILTAIARRCLTDEQLTEVSGEMRARRG